MPSSIRQSPRYDRCPAFTPFNLAFFVSTKFPICVLFNSLSGRILAIGPTSLSFTIESSTTLFVFICEFIIFEFPSRLTPFSMILSPSIVTPSSI